MVRMWQERVRLSSPTRAASVDDFPEPVGPQTRTRPRLGRTSSAKAGGRFKLASVGISSGRARIAAASCPPWRCRLTRKRHDGPLPWSSSRPGERRRGKSDEPRSSRSRRDRPPRWGRNMRASSSPSTAAESVRTSRPSMRKTGAMPAISSRSLARCWIISTRKRSSASPSSTRACTGRSSSWPASGAAAPEAPEGETAVNAGAGVAARSGSGSGFSSAAASRLIWRTSWSRSGLGMRSGICSAMVAVSGVAYGGPPAAVVPLG